MSDNLKITVSGVRAVVGDTLTTELVSDFGKAFGTLIGSGDIIIGTDTRTSREMVKSAIISGILSTGCGVIDIGIAPTPTVLLATRKFKAKGGIVVTASHNPSMWNGIKFAGADGTCLNEASVKKLIKLYETKKFKSASWDQIKSVTVRNDAIDLHIAEVLKVINPAKIRRKKFKVAVDCCNGTAAVISQKFLETLGCKVYVLNGEPNGHFAHDPEPVTKNLRSLTDTVKKKKCAIGFAQDPDADRLAIVADSGKAIGEENTLSLTLRYLLAKKRRATIVVNLSTSRMIDDIANQTKAKLIRSRIGEANVTDLMKKHNAFVGGEGNGGLIFPKVNFCRDSIAAMGIILDNLASENKSITDLVNEVKQYVMIKRKIECSQDEVNKIIKRIKSSFKKTNKINELDGVKVEWSNKWLHARGSNTEPVVRIMVEAESIFEAEDVYHLAKEVLAGKN